MVALDERLAANRGGTDFAYFFASAVTPRDLGDALATVAGRSEDVPLKTGIDPHAYELTLTDLAGTLALATHGARDRTLPETWTSDFVLATTTPTELYGAHDGFFDRDGKKRERQDRANRANLLLLLSRGYWSPKFLQVVTKEYFDFDRKEGDDAWPVADPDDDVGYAPAPNGAYLTDGVLALTAALTANSVASKWAFTEFQPGRVEIDGSDYEIGRFTHFLLFEHRFPEGSGDESIGMTAALTALSSAIDSTISSEAATQPLPYDAASKDFGPTHDSLILLALARDMAQDSGCSLNPLHYGHCVIAAAKAVWGWVRHWGHLVLNILTLATFAPPPFSAIGVTAAASNATWYAIEGDYGMAGLSLAAALPGLAFSKIAKGSATAKGAATAAKAGRAAAKTDEVAKAARWWRPMKPWKDCDLVPQGGLRLKYHSGWTPAQRQAADEKVKAIYEAAQRGELRKTLPQRSGTATSTYVKATGRSVPAGQDVDHTIDLQLGGQDDISNMKPLDLAVNRSLGIQIAAQLSSLEYGEPILGVAIC
ncbi:hypothetical protein ISU10_02465 [Nocardioides agariphilus]|uniref:Uncharacterized protein n=1 Tax=Nocardioides agariphilus TaxID=433664 RepID=A0A930VFN1_9ACTN|nr:hypothetical protein [Nocardioides agariphilus]MBF4766629.1 hypothetical protein [Nocardioides agariphilus]